MNIPFCIAAAVPQIRVADVSFNVSRIKECIRTALSEKADTVIFPELSLTGCTCGDLFPLPFLTDAALNGAMEIAREFSGEKIAVLVGLPIRFRGSLFNCMAVISAGKISGLVPQDAPAPFEYADVLKGTECFPLPDGSSVPFLKSFRNDIVLDVHAMPAEAGRAAKRRAAARTATAGNDVTYVCVQPGCGESTTDMVYDGQAILAFHGKLLAETNRFSTENQVICVNVDPAIPQEGSVSTVPFEPASDDPAPFLPKTPEERDELCAEILAIQSTGLARRMEASGVRKAVVGISGGLDSTLALLAAAETMKRLGRTPDSVIAITMPGFGTTGRTKSNAEKMAEELGCDLRKIDIRAVCLQHFSDIGHDQNVLDVTYENAQARERTQILMDVANREQALVVGTGDLSEIALGWCTFNGDHISMYNVNCGVPKTLMRVIVSWYADHACQRLEDALRDVLATPVSPELLPADPSGKIAQKTESILGAYELHDFYIWHFIKRKESPVVIRSAARKAFAGTYSDEEIDRTLKLFFRRFFTQQFKRSCCADGPHTTPVSLSPRTDWHMPSDASVSLWLTSLDGEN